MEAHLISRALHWVKFSLALKSWATFSGSWGNLDRNIEGRFKFAAYAYLQ